VLQQANQEVAVLLTADKDFGEVVFRQGRVIHGVILIRLAGMSPQQKAWIVSAAIREHLDELPLHFTAVPSQIKYLPSPAACIKREDDYRS
jgi:predicted nuclease of predicted toxin-antitoxin system